MNAAGYPSSLDDDIQYGRKGSLAFADLTGFSSGFSTTDIDNIVGWRNFASSQLSGISTRLDRILASAQIQRILTTILFSPTRTTFN